MSHLLKIRKRSPEQEEDQKASPRSVIEDLADKKKLFYRAPLTTPSRVL